MHNKTLTELSTALANKELSSVELTQHYLQRIATLGKECNSFITVTEELALQQAQAADASIASGNHSPLTGILPRAQGYFLHQWR